MHTFLLLRTRRVVGCLGGSRCHSSFTVSHVIILLLLLLSLSLSLSAWMLFLGGMVTIDGGCRVTNLQPIPEVNEAISVHR